MKQIPGMVVGTVIGLIAWLPTQTVGPAILLGVALGVGWDIWRKR